MPKCAPTARGGDPARKLQASAANLVDSSVWIETLRQPARRTGVTVRSSVDCLIAVCAIRNDLTLLHHDRDFDQLARIAPLRSHDVLTGS